MILVYLDNCSIQRPLDDRSQPRINLEAEAIITMLSLAESGSILIFSSEVLEFEIRQTPDLRRRQRANEIITVAKQVLKVTAVVRIKSQELMQLSIKPTDALHAAIAIENNVHYFCTCDDKLLKKLKPLNSFTCFLSPIEFIIAGYGYERRNTSN